jgi:hypothetical protein
MAITQGTNTAAGTKLNNINVCEGLTWFSRDDLVIGLPEALAEPCNTFADVAEVFAGCLQAEVFARIASLKSTFQE